MEQTKESKKAVLLAVIFVVTTYLVCANSFFHPDGAFFVKLSKVLMLLPVLLCALNIFYLKKNKDNINRDALLNAAVLVKYSLIPLFIAGFVLCLCCLLLMFTPIIIMAFAAPMMICLLCVLGWVYMICGSVFSVAYIRKASEEKVHITVLSVLAAICQFVFVLDVISIMVLTIKEKKHIAKTILVLLAVFMVAVIGIVRLIIMFLK